MSCTCAPSSAAAGRPPAPPAGCWGSRPGSRTGWPACPGCGRTASHQKQRNWSASGNNSTPFFFAVFNFKWFQNQSEKVLELLRSFSKLQVKILVAVRDHVLCEMLCLILFPSRLRERRLQFDSRASASVDTAKSVICTETVQ